MSLGCGGAGRVRPETWPPLSLCASLRLCTIHWRRTYRDLCPQRQLAGLRLPFVSIARSVAKFDSSAGRSLQSSVPLLGTFEVAAIRMPLLGAWLTSCCRQRIKWPAGETVGTSTGATHALPFLAQLEEREVRPYPRLTSR